MLIETSSGRKKTKEENNKKGGDHALLEFRTPGRGHAQAAGALAEPDLSDGGWWMVDGGRVEEASDGTLSVTGRFHMVRVF